MMLHVTMHVNNLEECLAFYEKYIGLHIVRDLRPMGSPIVFLAQGEGETNLELIGAGEAYKGSGISIGFPSADMEGDRARFIAEGLTVTPVIRPNPMTSFFYVTDPAGLQVQIMQK